MTSFPEGSSPRIIDHKAVLETLQALLETLDGTYVTPDMISTARRKKLRVKIDAALLELQRVLQEMSPVRMPAVVLDPSDPKVIGKLIADTLLEQPRFPLEAVPRFYGSGVYALYYRGRFDAYEPISGTETPLYVGKADPSSQNAQTVIEQGEKLVGRLNDHKRTLTKAGNLDIKDFDCRYLVVKSAWQTTAETYLIQGFGPVWNDEIGICYGFGKHGDSAATRSNTRSPWDTLHPGREWAWAPGNKSNPLSAEDIKRLIAQYYASKPPTARAELPIGSVPNPLTLVAEEEVEAER